MILMAMGQHETFDFALVLFQIRDIRDDIVHAQHILARENKAAIDDEDIILPLDDRHVFADLTDAAQGNNFHTRSSDTALFAVALVFTAVAAA